MANESIGGDVSPPSNRKFGLTFGIVFLVLAVIPPLLGGHFRWWLLAIGAVFTLIALVSPNLLKVPNHTWFRFGLLLHKIINPIVLAVLFFVVITPVATIMRLAGTKLLNRNFDPSIKSYWIQRIPPGPTADSIRNQF